LAFPQGKHSGKVRASDQLPVLDQRRKAQTSGSNRVFGIVLVGLMPGEALLVGKLFLVLVATIELKKENRERRRFFTLTRL
jgi:hypothetical protein